MLPLPILSQILPVRTTDIPAAAGVRARRTEGMVAARPDAFPDGPRQNEAIRSAVISICLGGDVSRRGN